MGLFSQALMADHVVRQEKAIQGDINEGILLAGQCIGNIDDVITCQELVDRIVAQAEGVLKANCAKVT